MPTTASPGKPSPLDRRIQMLEEEKERLKQEKAALGARTDEQKAADDKKSQEEKAKADELHERRMKAVARAKNPTPKPPSAAETRKKAEDLKKEPPSIVIPKNDKGDALDFTQMKDEDLKTMSKALGFKSVDSMKKNMMTSKMSAAEMDKEFEAMKKAAPEKDRDKFQKIEKQVKINGEMKTVTRYKFPDRKTANEFKQKVSAEPCYKEEYDAHQKDLDEEEKKKQKKKDKGEDDDKTDTKGKGKSAGSDDTEEKGEEKDASAKKGKSSSPSPSPSAKKGNEDAVDARNDSITDSRAEHGPSTDASKGATASTAASP